MTHVETLIFISLTTSHRFTNRPPEPIVPLDDAAIRIAELKALVAQGRAEADADNVRAGFFGGDGKTSLLLWGGVSVSMVVRTVRLSTDFILFSFLSSISDCS